MRFKIICLSLFSIQIACSQEKNVELSPSIPASIGIVGDTSDFKATGLAGGMVLMGGGKDVDEAMRWMIERAKGGDFVVIRATGSTGYNDYLYDLGELNSVETLLINSLELAENQQVANRIRQAEALFIAGGDQSNYVDFWKGTKTSEAINYLINDKKAVVGGTSAGCAIMGNIIYAALGSSVNSSDVLLDPFDQNITLQKDGFIETSLLNDVITDQHYSQRSRQGRHIVFMAVAARDYEVKTKGIGVDERTAVCISLDGNARVFGQHRAFFLWPNGADPENFEKDKPFTWNNSGKAVNVYSIQGSNEGSGRFELSNWETGNHSGGQSGYFFVDSGVFRINE